MATYSASVQKHQVKYLAEIDQPYVLLSHGSASDLTAMEHTVRALSPFNDVYVIKEDLLSKLHSFVNKHVLQSFIQSHQQSGCEFVVERIMHKQNGSNDHQRHIQLEQFIDSFDLEKQESIRAVARRCGARIYPSMSSALQFMAALLDAEMSLKDAQTLTKKRFNVAISIES
jgi:ribosome-binding ATPase YchF (GTP1/OBG family)